MGFVARPALRLREAQVARGDRLLSSARDGRGRSEASSAGGREESASSGPDRPIESREPVDFLGTVNRVTELRPQVDVNLFPQKRHPVYSPWKAARPRRPDYEIWCRARPRAYRRSPPARMALNRSCFTRDSTMSDASHAAFRARVVLDSADDERLAELTGARGGVAVPDLDGSSPCDDRLNGTRRSPQRPPCRAPGPSSINLRPAQPMNPSDRRASAHSSAFARPGLRPLLRDPRLSRLHTPFIPSPQEPSYPSMSSGRRRPSSSTSSSDTRSALNAT